MSPKPLRFLCLDCAHEFDAGPRPVLRAGELAGHEVTDGACPVCGGRADPLSWFIVQCQPKADAMVADRLRALGHLCLFLHYLLPVKRTNRTTPRKRHTEETNAAKIKRPLFPGGYVFAGLTPPHEFKAIDDTPGVAALLRHEGRPTPLDPREVDRLRTWGDKNGQVPLERPLEPRRRRFVPGDVVRILSGPFEGFERPVIEDDGKEMVKVLATLFGRDTEMALPYWQVEVIAEAA